jgi:hypothetical protein
MPTFPAESKVIVAIVIPFDVLPLTLREGWSCAVSYGSIAIC